MKYIYAFFSILLGAAMIFLWLGWRNMGEISARADSHGTLQTPQATPALGETLAPQPVITTDPAVVRVAELNWQSAQINATAAVNSVTAAQIQNQNIESAKTLAVSEAALQRERNAGAAISASATAHAPQLEADQKQSEVTQATEWPRQVVSLLFIFGASLLCATPFYMAVRFGPRKPTPQTTVHGDTRSTQTEKTQTRVMTLADADYPPCTAESLAAWSEMVDEKTWKTPPEEDCQHLFKTATCPSGQSEYRKFFYGWLEPKKFVQKSGREWYLTQLFADWAETHNEQIHE